MALQYPLNLRFKLVALAPRIIVTDASGQEVLFVSQKILNLKEDVRIFSDSKKTRELYRMRADRIIDFSANYRFMHSGSEQPIGSVKRRGMRSLWRATYFVDNAQGQTAFHLKEDNPWIKVLDALFAELPFLGLLGGFFFNPSYTAYAGADRENETKPVMRLTKRRAFFEGLFTIEKTDNSLSGDDELAVLLSLMMLIQLERRRG